MDDTSLSLTAGRSHKRHPHPKEKLWLSLHSSTPPSHLRCFHCWEGITGWKRNGFRSSDDKFSLLPPTSSDPSSYWFIIMPLPTQKLALSLSLCVNHLTGTHHHPARPVTRWWLKTPHWGRLRRLLQSVVTSLLFLSKQVWRCTNVPLLFTTWVSH